mmetsp:Transcript_10839/g.13666  ORF Transcript_10839/g.13666 Transcript_10839/m.13666 type:complete len:127 (-) Transcript_10839:368-748(-)
MKEFANGFAKARVLPVHLENMRKLSAEQFERETQIVRNIELVQARAEDLKQSSTQFLDGEEAYQRLARAKQLDARVNTRDAALPESRVELKSSMHDSYMHEIVEHGGAPSVEEITMSVDALGGFGA